MKGALGSAAIIKNSVHQWAAVSLPRGRDLSLGWHSSCCPCKGHPSRGSMDICDYIMRTEGHGSHRFREGLRCQYLVCIALARDHFAVCKGTFEACPVSVQLVQVLGSVLGHVESICGSGALWQERRRTIPPFRPGPQVRLPLLLRRSFRVHALDKYLVGVTRSDTRTWMLGPLTSTYTALFLEIPNPQLAFRHFVREIGLPALRGLGHPPRARRRTSGAAMFFAREGGNYSVPRPGVQKTRHQPHQPTPEDIKLWSEGYLPTLHQAHIGSSVLLHVLRQLNRSPRPPVLPSSSIGTTGARRHRQPLTGAILVSACRRRTRPASIWMPDKRVGGC